jgi:hypothetical protein
MRNKRKDEHAKTHKKKGTAKEAALQPVFVRCFDEIGKELSVILNFAMPVGRAQGGTRRA